MGITEMMKKSITKEEIAADMFKKRGTVLGKEALAEARAKLDKVVEEHEEEKKLQLAPVIQECMLKTKHGRTINCKYWVHTDKYFQYYEKGYELIDAGQGKYLITGDTVIVPEHEIMYVIIRKAQSALPEGMFLALGGKKKLIEVVGNDKNCDSVG